MKRSGFAILELLFVLALLGVFALLATQLFRASINVMHNAARTGESAMRFDSAMAVMRDDIFLSASTEMPDSNSLVVHRPDGSIVRWQTAGTEIQRTSGDTIRQWNVDQKIQLRQQGQIVLLQPATGAELAMASALEIGK